MTVSYLIGLVNCELRQNRKDCQYLKSFLQSLVMYNSCNYSAPWAVKQRTRSLANVLLPQKHHQSRPETQPSCLTAYDIAATHCSLTSHLQYWSGRYMMASSVGCQYMEWNESSIPLNSPSNRKKKSTISLPIFKNQRKLRTSSNSFIFFSFLIWQLANSCRNYFRGKGRCIWCVSATNRLWCISQHIINSDRTKGEWF